MRSSGILLHISSIPSKYGIGTLGDEAYKFVDFLALSKTKYWQILPIGPTSYGDSPYSSTSVFAFNPYFIDFEILMKDGLLELDDFKYLEDKSLKIDYKKLFLEKNKVLKKAYLKKHIYETDYLEFLNIENYWLEDYSLYQIIKEEHDYKPWNLWYQDFKMKDINAINFIKKSHHERLEEVKFIQYLFYRQWMNLKSYANKLGVMIIGDIPIYSAYDSSDVWANKANYDLDIDGTPNYVAGCPPDQFSADGQLWGNPLYNYELMKKNNYSFWIKRIKHSLKLFDILRIDHFRGFAGFYKIPYGEETARNGHWEKGPGKALFKEVIAHFDSERIIAENLGFLDQDVYDLLEYTKFKGMHIIQFEMGNAKDYCPLLKPFNSNNVIYTGTHDNQTIMSWYNDLDLLYKTKANEIFKIKITDKPNFKIIEYAYNSNVDMCIIPFQDFLGLYDDLGRMNTPSTLGSNWQYKARDIDFSFDLINYIKKITLKSLR